MLPIRDYWHAVAQAIDAEEAKASIFIKHKASIGVAREAILKDTLSQQTIEPYRITSGFIFQYGDESWSSRQCDIIICDPRRACPYYTVGELSVLPREAARLVIEVKTHLDENAFKAILDIWESVYWLPVPMLGFAYDGVRFQRFVEYLRAAIPTAKRGLPDCLVVHKQNYLYVRAGYTMPENDTLPNKRRATPCQFVVDFGAAGTGVGAATSVLLYFYNLLLRESSPRVELILDYCRDLGVSDEYIIKIPDTGAHSRSGTSSV